MNRAFLRAAMVERAALPPSGLLVATVPIAPVALDRLVAEREERAVAGPLLVWDAPRLEADGGRWSFAGWGEAVRLEATGADRVGALRIAAEALWSRVVVRRPPGLDAPVPRLFGGLAFCAEPSREAPWQPFADASFALPRWLLGTTAVRAWLQLALQDDELAGAGAIEAMEGELDGIEALLAASAGPPRAATPGSRSEVALVRTDPAVWAAMVHDALARIRDGVLEKVVPMVECRVSCGEAPAVPRALAELGARYPECARFAFERGGATFAGASPELLVLRRGRAVESDGLAGSAARRPGADEEVCRGLLASGKDRREHAVVVEAIRAALEPLCDELQVPATPGVRSLRNVHHLHTPVAGRLAVPVHVLSLVDALHPTPAVAGTPRAAALAWIAAHERSSRGWYAGAVGWFDAEGDGAFAVAIRSAVLHGREAWLYAGAGIVEGSDAAAEYEEARVKQAPMLAALGLLP